MIISTDLLHRCGVANPAPWAGPLTAAFLANQITTPVRIAGCLGNILHETGNLAALAESMDYSVAGLLAEYAAHFSLADAARMGRTAAHPADQRAIAERVYGGRYGNRAEGTGDGWLYRGHGGMQTTFLANYLALGHAIGWTQDVSALPAYLITPEGAATSAAVFWARAGCNALMDAGCATRARIVVNGGGTGLADALARIHQVAALLGATVAPPAPASSATDALNDEALRAAQAQ